MLRENNNFYYKDGQKERPKKKSEMLAMEKLKLRGLRRREELAGKSDELTSQIKHQEKIIANIEISGRPSLIKRTYRKPPKDFYEKVKAKVLEAKANHEMSVSAEELARSFNVKPHYAKQVLQKLNQEGLVTQAKHIIPHDCNRELTLGGGFSSWEPSKYFIYNEEED